MVELDHPALGPQGRGAAAEDQLDRVVIVPARAAEANVVGVEIAGEQALGERRAVIRRLGLGADDPDRIGVAAGAQRLRASLGGEPAADDHGAVATHA